MWTITELGPTDEPAFSVQAEMLGVRANPQGFSLDDWQRELLRRMFPDG